MPIADEQLVEIHWRARSPFGIACTYEVEIWNLVSWDGVSNTVRPGDAMLFAAADGVDTSMIGSAVTVVSASTGCADPTPRCTGLREALVLSFATDREQRTVMQGNTTAVARDGGSGYLVTDVSSFVTGECDAPAAFGWTVEETFYSFP
jgi:hypothetical protein